MYSIEIRHNFETAHRLSDPGAPKKCMSIHGHSWWVTVTMEGRALGEGDLLVEFGAFKKAWRGYLDGNVDHHLVLRSDDPMADAVRSVYPESRLLLLDRSPSTEVMAEYLFARAEEVLEEVKDPSIKVRIKRVHVQETAVNAAAYER